MDSYKGEKGLALVITLLVTAILTAVVTELVYAVYLHTSIAHFYKDSQRASLLAQAGFEGAVSQLRETLKGRSYFYLDRPSMAFESDEGIVEVRVSDEQGKVGINQLVYSNGLTNEEYYRIYTRFLKRLGLDESLADTMADWIDIDDEPRQNGAEGFYYKRLPRPYTPRNGYMDSVGELPMIKGYDQKAFKSLEALVTTYTDGLININTAPREVLFALSDEMDEGLVDGIIRYRERVPFKDKADILKVPGFETLGFGLQGRITVTSKTFRVFSMVTVNEAVREVEAIVQIDGGRDRIRYWRER